MRERQSSRMAQQHLKILPPEQLDSKHTVTVECKLVGEIPVRQPLKLRAIAIFKSDNSSMSNGGIILKKTIALALSILSICAHSAGIELSEEGKNQQSIYYYCALSDRFVSFSAHYALTRGSAIEKMVENDGKKLMLTHDEIQEYLTYMKSNLDVAQQVSRGYNSGQSCYIAPQKWIIGYRGLVEAGMIKIQK